MSFLDPLLVDSLTFHPDISLHHVLYSSVLGALFGFALLTPRILPLIYLHVLQPLGLLTSTAGCKRIGLPRSQSNLLHDELNEEKHLYGNGASGKGSPWSIKSLWVYPLKSCAGIELGKSSVIKTGLEHDRHFSFARLRTVRREGSSSAMSTASKTGESWEFATMREYPLLANVRAEVWLPDPSTTGYHRNLPAVRSGGVMRVVFPCKRSGPLSAVSDTLSTWLYSDNDAPYSYGPTTSFTVPFDPVSAGLEKNYSLETMRIWKDAPPSLNMAPHLKSALPHLKAYLGVPADMPFTLFRSRSLRPVFRDAPRAEQLGWQPVASFNDTYPINMLGLGSVRALDAAQHQRVRTPLTPGLPPPPPPALSARRFRANIILEGVPPFEEEEWTHVRLGGEDYHVVARCVRCKMPNVDPDTGLRHVAEPDRTIRATRAVDKGAPKGTGCMAVQLVPVRESGSEVVVGQSVEVLARGELVYTPM